MSSHTRGPRKRKSRPSERRAKGPRASASAAETVARPRASAAVDALPVSTTFGERPRARWHPLPLSELLILAGAIGAAIGLSRGFGGSRLMFAGVAAVALGTIEVTWREHRSGFRSHTLLLSLLPVVVLHSATVLVVAAVMTAPRVLNAALLVLDAAIFLVLFKLLRGSFLDARARAAARR
jgi:hypothetical protein